MMRKARWRAHGLLWIALLTCPLYAQSTPPTTAMEHEFQAAMAAQNSGDLTRAASLLLDLHARHPGLFPVDESLGMLYAAQDKYAKALPFFEAAVHEDSSSDVAHANLGAAYFKLHRNAQALSEFQEAVQLNPRNASTQQSLGELWMEAHQPARAADAYAVALQLRPDDADLLLAQAQALDAAGKSRQARTLLEGWSGAGESAPAQVLLGSLAEKAGDYRQAGKHYSLAVKIAPSEANVWALGLELLRHWTFEAAIQEFQSGARRFPKSVRMRLGLGVADFGYGSYAQSIPIFAGLLHGEPGNAFYAELLGMSCTAINHAAHSDCDALLSYAKAHPRNARAAVYAATDLLGNQPGSEQIRQAHALLQHAIQIAPKMGEARFQMGVLQQNQEQWAASIPSLKEALLLNPGLGQAHYRLALALWRTGRAQEAREQIVALKKYRQQHEKELDQQLSQITTFLVTVQQ